MIFQEKYFSFLTKYNCLITCASSENGQYVIAIVCFPDCDVINVEISHIFLMKPFSYMTKTQDENLNILRTRRTFKLKQKVFFIIFKGPSVAKNYLRNEIAPLTRDLRCFHSVKITLINLANIFINKSREFSCFVIWNKLLYQGLFIKECRLPKKS